MREHCSPKKEEIATRPHLISARGGPLPRVSPTPTWLLRAIGLVNKPDGAAAKVTSLFTDSL